MPDYGNLPTTQLMAWQQGARFLSDDGAPVTATFTPVGDGSYEFAAIRVQAGVQVVESTQPFGMAAYGYSNAVSYAYPGGLNLVTPAGGPE